MPDVSFCRQPGLGLLCVSGRDARKFLHAQTTQRIDDLPPQQTRLAAWLNAKGRVLGLFDVVPEGDTFVLILPADNAAAVRTGLSRYVLRDDVSIELVADRAVWTLFGDLDPWLAQRGIALPHRAVVVEGDATLARTGQQRVELIGRADALPSVLAGLAEAAADAAAEIAIAAGLPEMPAVLRERYVPQMLNLERLGAISFTKGCYPGQEIVARTQNLGEVKRRLRRLRAPAGARPAAGDGILDATGATVGEVNRAGATANGFEVLAVVGVEAGQEGLRLAGDNRALEPIDLSADGAGPLS